MKKLVIIILAVLMLGACQYKSGSGNIVTEKRNTGSFSGLSVGGDFNVEVTTGPAEITIEADDNIIKYIQTDVINGQLKIALDNINVHDAHLKVYITTPSLNSIKASASADIIVKDVLKANHIDLHASSGSEIEASIDAPESSLNASSGGELRVSGRTRGLNAESSSGSSIKAKQLLSEHTNVHVSSGASAKVHASVALDATASSGGNISYSGAANVKQSVSSGGEIEKE